MPQAYYWTAAALLLIVLLVLASLRRRGRPNKIELPADWPISPRSVFNADERQVYWRKLARIYPPYKGYQDAADRRIPLVVCEPGTTP